MKKTSRKGTPKPGATAKKPAKKPAKKAVKKAVGASGSSPEKALKARTMPTRPTGTGQKPTKTAPKKAAKKAAKKTVKKVVKKAAAKVAKAVKKIVKKVAKKTVRASSSSPQKASPEKALKARTTPTRPTGAGRKPAKAAGKVATAGKPRAQKPASPVAPLKKTPRPARPKSFPARPVEKAFGFAPGIPDLPDAYGENRLVLMTKDPDYLFAYWEITPERFAESAKAKRADDDYREAMRLNWDARELLDTNFAVLPVRLDARKWYMKVPYPGITYQVEIGWLSNRGHFIPILVSNPSDAPETWETTRLRLKSLKGMGADADDVIDYHLRVTHPMGASEQGTVERIPVPKPPRKELHEFAGPDSLSSSFGTKPQGSRRAPKARGPRK